MATIKNLLVDRNQQITAISAEVINLIKELKWPVKGTSKDAGFQCEIPASDGSVYKVEVLNDILSLSYMAKLLIKAHSGEELTPEEIKQPVIRIPEKIADLKGDELLEALVATYRHGSLRDPDQKESQAKANELLQEIADYDGAIIGATDTGNAIGINLGAQKPNEVVIHHEKGQFKAELSDNNVFKCGQLTMLKSLLEQNLIHSSDCNTIAKGLRDAAYTATHPKEALQHPAFLCHDFATDEKTGDILSDAFVILYNGKTLPPTISGRHNAKDDPTKKCVKIWTEIPRSAIMIGYVKEQLGAPYKFTVHKMREQGGFTLEPSGEQLDTVRDLLCNLGMTDARVDYTDRCAYQCMVGDGWDFYTPGKTQPNYKHTITKYAERFNKLNATIEEEYRLRIEINMGDNDFSVVSSGALMPFSQYDRKEAEAFKRFIMASEIRGFWQIALLHEERAPHNTGLAEKFKTAIPIVNMRNGHHLIVFDEFVADDDPRYGAYLSMPDRTYYFGFNQDDYQEFRYIVGLDQRPSKETTEKAVTNKEQLVPDTEATAGPEATEEQQSGVRIVNGHLQPGSIDIPSSLLSKKPETTKKSTDQTTTSSETARTPGEGEKGNEV